MQVPLRRTPVENWDLTPSVEIATAVSNRSAALYRLSDCIYNRIQADVAQLVEQSIRNRQVIGSSPIVGSTKFLRFIHLAAALAAITLVCVVNCVVTVPLRSHITL